MPPIKTVIYLDVLLLTNFALTLLFLLAAGLLAGVECRAGRLLLGGAAGAASSLALLAPEAPDAAALLYKVSTAALTVAAAYGWPGGRCFARLVGWFCAGNLLLAGALLLPGAQTNNGCIYLPLSPGALLAGAGGVVLAVQGVLRFLGRGSAHSREEYARELADTVAALGRHPCIGCWVPFNEGWGQFDARKATETLRALDPSRPVDEASGWFDRGGGDVHSIHNYFYPLRIRPNMRTVALSEYGGIAWPMPGHEPPRKTYGYGTARSRAELTERYCDLQRKTVLPQLKKGLSALVYTQLTDVEDEVNGLFTYDRTAIKPDAAAVRAVNEALEAEFEKAVKA